MRQLLIVDDDPHLLNSLAIVFEGLYTVETALSGEHAMRQMERCPPDVVLLDVLLPDTGGIELLRTVRQRYSLVPVVMISGIAAIRTVITALESGAAGFVRKPFDVHELRITIARALHTADLEREVQQLRKQIADSQCAQEASSVPLKQAVDAFERDMIERALAASGGINTRAAERLGTTRRILQYRIQKLGIPCAKNGD